MATPITEELLVVNSFRERESCSPSEVATSTLPMPQWVAPYSGTYGQALNGLSVSERG